jgi:hypothetical protein
MDVPITVPGVSEAVQSCAIEFPEARFRIFPPFNSDARKVASIFSSVALHPIFQAHNAPGRFKIDRIVI